MNVIGSELFETVADAVWSRLSSAIVSQSGQWQFQGNWSEAVKVQSVRVPISISVSISSTASVSVSESMHIDSWEYNWAHSSFLASIHSMLPCCCCSCYCGRWIYSANGKLLSVFCNWMLIIFITFYIYGCIIWAVYIFNCLCTYTKYSIKAVLIFNLIMTILLIKMRSIL